MGDFTPLSDHPTLAELGRATTQVHNCLEGHIATTTKELGGIKQQQALMLLALGVDPEKPDATRPARTVATMTTRQLTWRIAAAGGSAAGTAVVLLEAWRWAGRLLPGVWSALQHLNHIVVGN